MRVYLLCAIGGLCIAISLFVYAAWCGVGFTYDSTQYYAASQSLKAYHRLRMANGEPYIVWTPLFPILLAFFSIQTHTWIWFNALCLALMYLATGLLFFCQYQQIFLVQFSNSRKIDIFFALVFFVGLSISTPVHLLYHFAWSEGVFVVLLQFAFFFIYQYFATRRSVYFYSLLLCSALLCLQRHAGFFLVVGFGITIGIYRGLGLACIYTATALIGWGAWVVYIVSYYPQRSTRFTAFLGQHLLGNLWGYAQEIGVWFAPNVYLLHIVVLVLIGAVCLWARRGMYWQVATMVILPYLAGISLIGAVNYSDSARFLAVLYPSVWTGIVLSLRSLAATLCRYTQAAVLCAIWLVLGYQSIRTVHNLNRWQAQSCASASNGSE